MHLQLKYLEMADLPLKLPLFILNLQDQVDLRLDQDLSSPNPNALNPLLLEPLLPPQSHRPLLRLVPRQVSIRPDMHLWEVFFPRQSGRAESELREPGDCGEARGRPRKRAQIVGVAPGAEFWVCVWLDGQSALLDLLDELGPESLGQSFDWNLSEFFGTGGGFGHFASLSGLNLRVWFHVFEL